LGKVAPAPLRLAEIVPVVLEVEAVVVAACPAVVSVDDGAVVDGPAVVVVVPLPQPTARMPSTATISSAMAIGMIKRLLAPRRTILVFLTFVSPGFPALYPFEVLHSGA
jgi:hypothetical protein